jgi:hypothetical protein
MSEITRRDQIRFHWRCIVTNGRKAYSNLRDLLWHVPGLVRALFNL